MQRQEILNDLVTFSKPIENLIADLSGLDWDYDGQPLVVNALQIKNVLLRYMNNQLDAEELESWANLIECREDVEFEKQYQDAIETAIYCLANPSLEGEITKSSCQALIQNLIAL